MHKSVSPARAVTRVDLVCHLVSKAKEPSHGAIGMAVIDTEAPRRYDDNRWYRKEEVRLLLADGSVWRLPEILVEAGQRSVTLRSAAWSLLQECKRPRQHPCWIQMVGPCLAE